MPEFKVCLSDFCWTRHKLTVEAESVDEARQKAVNEFNGAVSQVHWATLVDPRPTKAD